MSKTSVPQVKQCVPAGWIVDQLQIRFARMWADAIETKNVDKLKKVASLSRQAYEAMKLRCNDGEIPFRELEACRIALEDVECAIEELLTTRRS